MSRCRKEHQTFGAQKEPRIYRLQYVLDTLSIANYFSYFKITAQVAYLLHSSKNITF